MKEGFAISSGVILIIVLIIVVLFVEPCSYGAFPYGPKKTLSVTVLSKHVDISTSKENSQTY